MLKEQNGLVHVVLDLPVLFIITIGFACVCVRVSVCESECVCESVSVCDFV